MVYFMPLMMFSHGSSAILILSVRTMTRRQREYGFAYATAMGGAFVLTLFPRMQESFHWRSRLPWLPVLGAVLIVTTILVISVMVAIYRKTPNVPDELAQYPKDNIASEEKS